MSFWLVRFIAEWGVWLVAADKSRWRELLPVCFLAALLGATTDTVIQHHPVWQYDCEMSFFPNLDNTWSMYIVTTYLFIQYLPKHRTFWRLAGYFFFWTGLAIFVEWIHIVGGHMSYSLGWTIYYSYLADWILLWILYQYHKLFGFARLNRSSRSSE